jgi:UDP:flavonoid glycosyltransferase YjiC (YdhE family)
MARILIYTAGTLGDHLPVIALAQALKGRGHGVKLVINQAMRSYAERAGIECVSLSDHEFGSRQAQQDAWAWDEWHYPDQQQHPKLQKLNLEMYLNQARELAVQCQQVDLLLATPYRALGYIAAQASGVPWMSLSLNPSAFWLPTTPEDQAAWEAGQAKEYNRFKVLIDRSLVELGVKKTTPDWVPGWHLARHVLLASSPHFYLPEVNQFQPHSSLEMTGFWFYQDPEWESWEAGDSLREFCEPAPAGRRLLVLSFSSQPLEDPGRILRLHIEAAACLWHRILVQRGWSGFSADALSADFDPERVLFVDYLPHDWVFAQAACAFQHGGIGSIARALRQGCPLVVEPFGHDQFFNARCVAALGVGVAIRPYETTSEGLARILQERVFTAECSQRVAKLGSRICQEDGLGKACEYIERYLSRLTSSGQHPAIYERFTPPLTRRPRLSGEAG